MLFGHQLFPFLSYCFLNGSSLVTLCLCKTVHHAVHIEPRQLRDVVPDFAREKTSGSTAAVTKQDGDHFSTFSVERSLRLLITLCFFCILTCHTSLLSVSGKLRNIKVDFCVHINECLLTEICV